MDWSTGTFTNWAGPVGEMGPLYPFVGLEWLFLIICVVMWLGWHIRQMAMENSNYRDDTETLKHEGNMERALKGERILRPM
jgi:hypothetical protein